MATVNDRDASGMSGQDECRLGSTPREVRSARTGISAAERRRYFRIKDQVALKYRVISEQEYADAVAGMPEPRPGLMSLANSFAASTRQIAPTVRRIRELHPEICRYLGMVNEKLDMLARAFSIAESEMAGWPTQRICLSAGGLSFDAQSSLPDRARLKITLVLFPSLVHIIALATVVRCRTRCNDEVGHRIAVEFTDITEEDRELLIQHIVQRESRRLRARRLEAQQASAVCSNTEASQPQSS